MRIYVRHEPSKWRTIYYKPTLSPIEFKRVSWLDCVAYGQHVFNGYKEN